MFGLLGSNPIYVLDAFFQIKQSKMNIKAKVKTKGRNAIEASALVPRSDFAASEGGIICGLWWMKVVGCFWGGEGEGRVKEKCI